MNIEHTATGIVSSHMRNKSVSGMERIVFFSDAVFAIAITLLALEIRLPEIGGLGNAALFESLLSIYPKYLSFIVSFLVIGNFWLVHHRQFHYIERYDTPLILINLFILMSIAFIPFPTVVISENGNRVATIFYALTMSVVGLLLFLLWFYASRGRRLITPELMPARIRRIALRTLIAPVIFLCSVALAYIHPDVAKFSWLLIAPAIFIIQ
ncbi:MAG: TMEM175 family protein [Roseiflexaceae bacterium]|nr:TMEM175 family protein [Roseiflexus sp.]MDW8147678.1 TMEM175 family protein [Roseiflexaceae bacterium]MDW8214525.1 TMEM175 family protein [Roseiflexaceae bacterium]